jgi:hypothetical protein
MLEEGRPETPACPGPRSLRVSPSPRSVTRSQLRSESGSQRPQAASTGTVAGREGLPQLEAVVAPLLGRGGPGRG